MNGSAGTDHGTAGVVFLAGPGVRGGVAGSVPNLTDLAAGRHVRIDYDTQDGQTVARAIHVRGPRPKTAAMPANPDVVTGVLRRVESNQWQWLKAALERSRGKFTMAILGHPLYAGGRYQGGPSDMPL